MSMEGLDAHEAAMRRAREALIDAAKEIVATDGAILVREAQSNFSGSHRRGEPHVGGSQPNIVSGDTRRSLRAEPVATLGVGIFGTSVAPHVAWGRRLELGFTGADSLGRQFQSKGYPFFQPAVNTARQQFTRVNAGIVKKHMASVR